MSDNDTDGETGPNDSTQGENDSIHEESLTREIDAGERPSRAVVRAVATLTDADVIDLDPLYDSIDPEHLDGTIESLGHTGVEECSVSFRFSGCLVTVNRDTVHVRTDAD